MISGYVMMMSTERSDNSKMLIRRYLRIAPPYYIMTLAVIVINLFNQYIYRFKEFTDISLYRIFTSVTFFAFLPDGLSTIVSVGWTVSIEMFFYLLFYCSYRISFKHRGLLTIVGILLIQVLCMPLSANNYDFPYARYQMIFFAIGILIWYLKQLVNKDIGNIPKYIQNGLVFISFLAFIMLCIYYHKDTQTLCALSTVTLIFGSWILLLDNFKFPKALIWVGDRSYSIYLTHALTLQFCIQLIHPLNEWNLISIVYFIGYTVFILIISEIYYEIIEKRFTGWITKKCMSRAVAK